MGNTTVLLRLKKKNHFQGRLLSYLSGLWSLGQGYCCAYLFFWMEEGNFLDSMDFEMEPWFLTIHFINSKRSTRFSNPAWNPQPQKYLVPPISNWLCRVNQTSFYVFFSYTSNQAYSFSNLLNQLLSINLFIQKFCWQF